MLKAAIAIDDWKLPTFERHLSGAGYQFDQHPGLADGTLTLTVTTSSVKDLEMVVRSANTEAQKRKLQ
jgi:hypothetical protein